jgi:hypothetical protein
MLTHKHLCILFSWNVIIWHLVFAFGYLEFRYENLAIYHKRLFLKTLPNTKYQKANLLIPILNQKISISYL